jgi:cold shock CspA family protein
MRCTFHRNALVDADFEELEEGTEVMFVEEQGQKGPQAKSVTVGKPRRSA